MGEGCYPCDKNPQILDLKRLASLLLVQGIHIMYFVVLGKLNVECVFINLVSRVLHLPTPLSPWEQGCKFKKCIFISSISKFLAQDNDFPAF